MTDSKVYRLTLFAGALVAVLVIVGIVAVGTGVKPPESPVGTFTSSDGPPASVHARAPVHVNLSLRGSGNKITQKFEAPDPLRLQWSYDCSHVGGSGAFAVALSVPDLGMGDGGQLELPVNDFGAGSAGDSYTHHAGAVWLEIMATCPWTLRVSG